MKYIVMCDNDGAEIIILFPKTIHHDAMADSVSSMRDQTHGPWRRIFRTPVSAGFVSKNKVCHGRSETLALESRPEDTALLIGQF